MVATADRAGDWNQARDGEQLSKSCGAGGEAAAEVGPRTSGTGKTGQRSDHRPGKIGPRGDHRLWRGLERDQLQHPSLQRAFQCPLDFFSLLIYICKTN